MLWEELLVLRDQLSDFSVCVPMDFLILAEGRVLEILDGQDELLFREMGTVKDGVLLRFEVLWVGFCHLLASVDKVAHWVDDVVLNIFDQSIDEWASDLSDPALDPDIVMQEISLAC